MMEAVLPQFLGVIDQFAQRVDLRADQFVGLTEGSGIAQAIDEGIGHIGRPDRLEACMAKAEREERQLSSGPWRTWTGRSRPGRKSPKDGRR
jgi:hypothetical protein